MDDSQGNRANNKRRRTEAAHDLQLEDVMAQRLRGEAKAIEDRRSCICQGALYKGGAYPHQWNCQGCSCTDSFETPIYSDATRRPAVSLEKPEEAVDIIEMEYR